MHADLAWAYDFPTRQLLPITGMIAFYNEKVDTFVGGQLLERPETHFSRSARTKVLAPDPDQPSRNCATRASDCWRVSLPMRPAIGSTWLPPARKTT